MNKSYLFIGHYVMTFSGQTSSEYTKKWRIIMNKILQRISSIIICLAVLNSISQFTDNAYAETEKSNYSENYNSSATTSTYSSGDFTFYLNGDICNLTKYYGNNTVVTIPSLFNGKPVNGISDYAFCNCGNISEIVLPKTITAIGNEAFDSCSSLKKITLPDSVNSIGGGAFSDCTSLETISIPEGVTIIEDSTFYNCKALNSIQLPSTLSAIGDEAFRNCFSLRDITIPAGVSDITSAQQNHSHVTDGQAKASTSSKAYAHGFSPVTCFMGCTSLASINVDSANNNFSSVDGLLLNKSKTELMYVPAGAGGTVNIPEGVTKIRYQALSESSAETISIPASLTEIEDPTSTLPNPSENTDSKLKTINVNSSNQTYSSVNGALLSNNNTVLLYVPTAISGEYTIPNSVTELGNYCFDNCKLLTKIILGDNLSKLGNGTAKYTIYSDYTPSNRNNYNVSATENGYLIFSECDNLSEISVSSKNKYFSSFRGVLYNKDKSICLSAPCGLSGTYTLPNSAKTVDKYAFFACSKLKNVNLSKNTLELGDYCFDHCSSLESVKIPASVSMISSNAFLNCPSLTKFDIDSKNKSYKSNGSELMETYSNKLLLVSRGISGSYTVEDGITSISDEAFMHCTKLTDVTIPDSVTEIGERAAIDDKNNRITVHGSENSYAQQYADYCGISFATVSGSAPFKENVHKGYIRLDINSTKEWEESDSIIFYIWDRTTNKFYQDGEWTYHDTWGSAKKCGGNKVERENGIIESRELLIPENHELFLYFHNGTKSTNTLDTVLTPELFGDTAFLTGSQLESPRITKEHDTLPDVSYKLHGNYTHKQITETGHVVGEKLAPNEDAAAVVALHLLKNLNTYVYTYEKKEAENGYTYNYKYDKIITDERVWTKEKAKDILKAYGVTPIEVWDKLHDITGSSEALDTARVILFDVSEN